MRTGFDEPRVEQRTVVPKPVAVTVKHHAGGVRRAARPQGPVRILVLWAAAAALLVGCQSSAGDPGASPIRHGTGAPTAGGKVLDFPALWSRRASLVDKTSTVDATVMFALRCPPPDAGASAGPCVAVGYVVDDRLDSLPAQPDDVALALYDRDRPVACGAQTVAGLTCSGWRAGGRYRLRGVVRHQSVQGRQLPNLLFDVAEHSRRR
jgi:hypothetical protein